MKGNKVNAAIAALQKSRRGLEGALNKLDKFAANTPKEKRAIAREKKTIHRALDRVDSTEVQLLSLRETVAQARPRKNPRRLPKGEHLIGERELLVRGFWDRYPRNDRKKGGRFAEKFAHIPKGIRGPTAYDELAHDYLSFTDAQRKRLQIRVSYGVNQDTGKIFTSAELGPNGGLRINLDVDRNNALNGLQTLLVRAGVVNTPTRNKRKKAPSGAPLDSEELQVPIGIEWWIV